MHTLHKLALKGGTMQQRYQQVHVEKVQVHQIIAQVFVGERVRGLFDAFGCEFPLEGW